MTTEDKHSPEITAMMAQWMDQASRVWKEMLQAAPPDPTAAAERAEADKAETKKGAEEADRFQWEPRFARNWQTFFEAMAPPDLASMMPKAEPIPPTAARMAESSWQFLASIQKSWAEQFSRFGDPGNTMDWFRPDEETVRQWQEFYDTEIRKYLTVPHIGLNKFTEEKINWMIDRFNAKHLALTEFFDILFRPVKEGAIRMQEQIKEYMNKGQFPENPKILYRDWIKFVEGRYMILFRSDEFIRTLQKAVLTTLEFHSARKEVLEEAARYFSLPTNRDLDDVYRDVHHLKQQMRTMESQLHEYTAHAASAATAG